MSTLLLTISIASEIEYIILTSYFKKQNHQRDSGHYPNLIVTSLHHFVKKYLIIVSFIMLVDFLLFSPQVDFISDGHVTQKVVILILKLDILPERGLSSQSTTIDIPHPSLSKAVSKQSLTTLRQLHSYEYNRAWNSNNILPRQCG